MKMIHKKWILLVLLLPGFWEPILADPLPGDIFREYVYGRKVDFFKGAFDHLDSVVTYLGIDDLDQAVRAEAAFYYWGGHIGTSFQQFRVNGGELCRITQPETPGNPECYYRTVSGRSAVGFPVADLVQGRNTITFYCGEQICHGFNWPHYWIYNYLVRVYYQAGKACQKGSVTKPAAGSQIGDYPGMEIALCHPDSVQRVDYIAFCDGFDADGDGKWKEWQYRVMGKDWDMTAATVVRHPFKAVWDNRWVPDQNAISLMARITDHRGYCYMTEPSTGLSLKRETRVVRMYKPESVAEAFGVRIGQRLSCRISIPEEDLRHLSDARIFVSTWSADAEDSVEHHEIGINKQAVANKFGRLHDHDQLMIPFPADILRPENSVYIFSETEGHALEVNWPGPALITESRIVRNTGTFGCKADIRKSSDGYPQVFFGNEVFSATIRSHAGGKCKIEHAIRDWTLKGRNVNQVTDYIDACAQRGPLVNARIVCHNEDSLVIRLEYKECDSPDLMAVSEYTLYPGSPFIKINYRDYPAGWWNTVDIGMPGGKESGKYHIYGEGSYHRKKVLYPQSYWNTHDPEYAGDPRSGGSLNYRGYMILLTADTLSGVGFGRIMPVKTETDGGIKILKLLSGKGFETFPATGEAGKPFVGSIFVFEEGFESAIQMAMEFIDRSLPARLVYN